MLKFEMKIMELKIVSNGNDGSIGRNLLKNDNLDCII